MDAGDIATLTGLVAILGFLWNMNKDFHREIAELRERMAKIEGLFEGFTRSEPPRA